MELFTLRGHTDAVRSVCYNQDDTQLVSGSWDGTIKIWDPATGAELHSISVGSPVYAVACSPEIYSYLLK